MELPGIRTYFRYSAAALLTAACCLFHGQSYADGINARAAVVLDGQSGKILYAKNPNTRLQPASTTKLVTAMVVLDRMDPGTVVTVSKEAARTPSIAPRLRAGDKLTIRDLMRLALIRSVNAAAVALAEAVSGTEQEFVQLMNEKVRAIGAENTEFINASGLPGEGQHITAFDLSLIMKESLRYPVVREIINTRMDKVYTESGRGLSIRNTNHLLWNDDDVVGGKTGFTRSAGHCLAFAVQKGDTVIVASLLAETDRSKIWDNSATLLAFGEDVLTGKRQPEIYYTADAEAPFMMAAKSKSYQKRAAYKQLASNKATKYRSNGEGPAKKQVKKKSHSKQKYTVANTRVKRPARSIS